MTYAQLVRTYGTYKVAAIALNLAPTTVHSWRSRGIPAGRQFQIEVATGGKLRAERRNGART